jgi:hypothetical protein
MAKPETSVVATEHSTHPPAVSRELNHAEIQECAYFRYLDRGCIDGFDREDWLLAEAELRGANQPVRSPA